MIYQKIQNARIEEKHNDVTDTEIKNQTLTQKVLKENKPPPPKKKNDISDESQKKLDIIMNITNNICN